MQIAVCILLIQWAQLKLSEGTEPTTWMDVTFRIKKLNFVWSKAVHHLSDKSLIKQLKNELDKFDSLYLSAKAGTIKNSKMSIEDLDNKLEKLLEKYGLESALTAYLKKYKWQNEEEMKKANSILPSEKFTDLKLQKLWHAALNSKFSEAALKALHKELKDHERKMKLYDQKVQEFNRMSDNTLLEDNFERNDQLSRDLKEYYKSITDSYDKLHQKIAQVSHKVFNNEKVENLWQLALQNPNFTASELESIRVELRHFDGHLDKLKYHNEELEAAKEKQKKLGKINVFDDDVSSFEQENKRLSRKLKKLGNYLEEKIIHSEL
ncbi:unnamed protein product [Thelazia callipaeda]|uniref:Alpha-2-MRAP_C domain-containing protein n=1 Tax=Thelazia callipaeda TaxID=103827 RepID=A0A0N5CR98_THECL|nr:unnamed protein product [Thelazia callipaeda]